MERVLEAKDSRPGRVADCDQRSALCNGLLSRGLRYGWCRRRLRSAGGGRSHDQCAGSIGSSAPMQAHVRCGAGGPLKHPACHDQESIKSFESARSGWGNVAIRERPHRLHCRLRHTRPQDRRKGSSFTALGQCALLLSRSFALRGPGIGLRDAGRRTGQAGPPSASGTGLATREWGSPTAWRSTEGRHLPTSVVEEPSWTSTASVWRRAVPKTLRFAHGIAKRK